MNDERGYAMPKLYGAPAYARPPSTPVAPSERPFDPDDLPLECARTDEDPEPVGETLRDGAGAVAVGESAAGQDGERTGGSRLFKLRLPGR